jgi:UDP-N-acetylmuramoyl-tripeptide--D-alanyl-D-alanine ligase
MTLSPPPANAEPVAALVSRVVADPLPQLRVADTRLALGQLAAAWRSRFTGPLIALTGSNGKTTLKEMIAAILRGARLHAGDRRQS